MDAARDLDAPAAADEPAAQFALARSLLSAPDATQEHFTRAVELVEAASAAGCAPALEMRALFEAMGVARLQNWDRAFDTLQLAAECGSANAQRQLLLLADPWNAAERPASADPGEFWSAKRREISLERLLHHADRRALSDKPRIRAIEKFASPAECRWLMERARTMLKTALVFDADGRQVADPGRSNRGTDFQLPDMDLVLEVIRARISAATRLPLPVFEPTQVLHYAVGQEFKPHRDFLDPANAHHQQQLLAHGQRIATFLIYLNEEFEGGETEFPEIGLGYRGRTGDALFWANVDMEGRPDPMTLHAGLPPAAGEKWVLSQWIRDRAGQGR